MNTLHWDIKEAISSLKEISFEIKQLKDGQKKAMEELQKLRRTEKWPWCF